VTHYEQPIRAQQLAESVENLMMLQKSQKKIRTH
jgi:hypothetical protein